VSGQVEVNTPDSGGATPVINVTPLVDVVLVLLIIFMVVIPAMQEGKPIEMVKVEAAETSVHKGLEPLQITIDESSVYSYEEHDLPREEVLDRLRQLHERQPDRRVLLRGDAALDYSTVRDFFNEVREIGFKGVSLAVAVQREWSEED
jgi:biopolymer transport protein ExbD